MKRKLVALIVAIMMIGSCVGAFAIDGNGTYEQKDITAIENALATYYPAEQVIEGYTIKDGGLWMIVKLTTYSLRNSVAVGEPADADYVKYDNDRTEASMLAFLEKVVKEKTTTEAVAVGATEVIAKNIEELLANLDTRERELIILRYYCNETQSKIAEYFGVSQVQVSRMEKRVLRQLREKINS